MRRLVKTFLDPRPFRSLILALLLTTGAMSSTAADMNPAPSPLAAVPTLITNLAQLASLGVSDPAFAEVRLEFLVCAASRPDAGVVIAMDSSGVELLELGRRADRITAGDKLRIECRRCLLRRRQFGVEIAPAPVVANDGVHALRTITERIHLKSGRHPLRLDWFNHLKGMGLEVTCQPPHQASAPVAGAALWRTDSGAVFGSDLVNGLRAECYEGYWETLPDFDLLEPARTGATTNFDLQFRTRDEMVGIRFSGYFEAPVDGLYEFGVQCDDGAFLFLDEVSLPATQIGSADVPAAPGRLVGEPMDSANERHWAALEGRVSFVTRTGKGFKLELRADPGSAWVTVADADGIDPQAVLDAHVRVTGVARSVLTADHHRVLGGLAAASGRQITVVENGPGPAQQPVLTAVRQIHGLHIEEAAHGLPVRIRGVITTVGVPYDHWMAVQDGTRGIFVGLGSLTNLVPVWGQFCEVVGHTEAGDFAPTVAAEEVTLLGDGRLPDPARPTWNELINGSADVQWVEFRGLVTATRSNTMTMLLPEGHLNVQVDGCRESELKPFEKAVVRIRGVFFAVWDTETRAVRVGTVRMRSVSINVETPAPAEPFDLPLKSIRDLFLFDPHATAFQRVKIRGQVILAEPARIVIMDRESGMRVLPVQSAQLNVGDFIEAVGYPDISGSAPLLREAIVRKTAAGPLPASRLLAEGDFQRKDLDATLVCVEGTLMGTHLEQGSQILEMRAYGHLFLARFRSKIDAGFAVRPGSKLQLTGVYVWQGSSDLQSTNSGSLELLLNSPASVVVLSQPSWWTPQRLITVVGILLVGLALAAIWISQLRRQVEQRTRQLHREIRERETAERQRALESERSRIARDLHDDLGSSLTEIGVLASTGLRRDELAASPPASQRPQAEEDTRGLFRTIAAKARGLIAALDVIVWAVDPEDNSLQSVADYLSGFASEYLSHSTITCRFKIPVSFPPLMLDGRLRHDLLLTVKETLNNVVRHGLASEVEFKMAVIDEVLTIEITDNGKGFDPSTARPGSGLKNLSSRLTAHGGDCRVDSTVGKGTSVLIRLPLLHTTRPAGATL